MSTKLVEEENTIYEIDEECMRLNEEGQGEKACKEQEAVDAYVEVQWRKKRGISNNLLLILLIMCCK